MAAVSPSRSPRPAGGLLPLLALAGAPLLGALPAPAQVIAPSPAGSCPAGFQLLGAACVNPDSAPGWTYPKPAGDDCLPDWMYIPEDDECLRN